MTLLTLGAAILMSGAACAQTGFIDQKIDQQLAPFQQMILDSRLADAESLLRKVLPTPASEPKDRGGFLSISPYNLMWAMVVTHYVGANDYASAERVARERLQLAQGETPVDSYRVQEFTFLLADTLLTEGNYATATPLYERLLSADVGADFQTRTFLGMAEALMAQGRAAEAERFLKPIVFADGADPARPAAFHEGLYNAYAVALRDAGQNAAADQIIAQVSRDSSRPADVDLQDRDLLRARLLRARGSFTEAEALYREWIKHWDDRPAPSGMRREMAAPRLKPLEEYAHFLTLRRRLPEAQAVRVRLRSLERQYGVEF